MNFLEEEILNTGISNMNIHDNKYHKYAIEFGGENQHYTSRDEYFSLMLEYVKEKYLDIYNKLRHGDFIENITVSRQSERSVGLYMIEKKDETICIVDLDYEIDEVNDNSGTIPIQFVGLRDFIPFYYEDLIQDEKCQTTILSSLFPMDIDFLRNKEIKKFKETKKLTYSECEFQGKKILVVYPLKKEYKFTKNKVEYYICYQIDQKDIDDEDTNCIEDYLEMNDFDFELSDKVLSSLHKFTFNYDLVLMPWIQCLIPSTM